MRREIEDQDFESDIAVERQAGLAKGEVNRLTKKIKPELSVWVAARICYALRINLDWLIFGIEPKRMSEEKAEALGQAVSLGDPADDDEVSGLRSKKVG